MSDYSSTVQLKLCVHHSSGTGMVQTFQVCMAMRIWNREMQCTLRGQIYTYNFPCSLEGTNNENKFPPRPMQ